MQARFRKAAWLTLAAGAANITSLGAGAAESEEGQAPLEQVIVTGRFLESDASSAMKLDVPVRDTPFSVASYSDSFLKAIETTNVADLYNYMNGVKRAGNTGYDMTIRGFRTQNDDKNAIMVDGMPGLTGRFGSPPTIGVERIEVVKGPMSLLYGQIQPGGFVNIISKKPQVQRSGSIDIKGMTYSGDALSLGDANGYNVAVDLTGAIDSQERFLYRFVGEYTDKDMFRYSTYETGWYVAPSFTWNISDTTSATFIYEHRDVENAFDIGLVAPERDINLVAPIITRYQDPDDYRDEVGDTYSLQVRHEFSDEWSLNAAVRIAENESFDRGFTTISVVPGVTPGSYSARRRTRSNINGREYKFGDLSLTGSFATGGLGHKLIIGVNGGRDTSDENRLVNFRGRVEGVCTSVRCLDVDVYNPVYGAIPFEAFPIVNANAQNTLTHQNFQTDQIGIYVNDLITLSDHWKVSLGARTMREEQDIIEKRQPVPPASKESKKSLLPAGGVLFQPNDIWTVYSSYSESYVPPDANEIDQNGVNSFEPEEAQLVEVGAKAEGMFDGRVNATVSLFQIDKENTLNALSDAECGAFLGCSQQVGAERSKGAELEMNVQPIDNWQFSFNYTYIDARVSKTNADTAIALDARLPNVAYNSANMWSRYDVLSGPLDGLGFGLGIVYTGERTGNLPTNADPRVLMLPAYTVVDAALYYLVGRYSFNLKVGNVFDELYYESAGFTGPIQIQPGAPRNVTLSMRANF